MAANGLDAAEGAAEMVVVLLSLVEEAGAIRTGAASYEVGASVTVDLNNAFFVVVVAAVAVVFEAGSGGGRVAREERNESISASMDGLDGAAFAVSS